MNKGMFYLLPFLVLTPVAASSALTQVEVAGFMNILEPLRTSKSSKATLTTSNPISGRNKRSGTRAIKTMKNPRAGRNKAFHLKGRKLIKR